VVVGFNSAATKSGLEFCIFADSHAGSRDNAAMERARGRECTGAELECGGKPGG